MPKRAACSVTPDQSPPLSLSPSSLPNSEIMFGIIDFMTLVFLHSFYKEKTDKGILKGHTQYKVYRALLLSTVTFGATIMATIINNQIPAIGLTSSIIDITTDILSMMRVYTRPPQTDVRSSIPAPPT